MRPSRTFLLMGLLIGWAASVCGASAGRFVAVTALHVAGSSSQVSPRKDPKGSPSKGTGPRRAGAKPAAVPVVPLRRTADQAKAQRPWWDWLGVTQTSEPKVRYVGPKSRQKPKPWWDWLGVTEDKTPRSARGLPRTRVVRERPWWDWLGVTEQTPQKRAAPTRRQKPQRPWWDWLGVTEDGRTTRRRPQTRGTPRPQQRPWWDWLGVTQGESPDQNRGRPRTGVLTRPPRPRERARPQQAKRPWWDWLGITDKQPPSRRTKR